jgi:hypothetical protein
MNIKDLVKDNIVRFDSYRQSNFYYNVVSPVDNITYQFTVPTDDIGTATLLYQDKAITYMRWIRKAINDGTLLAIH